MNEYNFPEELLFKIVYYGCSSNAEDSLRFLKAISLTSKNNYALAKKVQAVWISDTEMLLSKIGVPTGSFAVKYVVCSQITYVDLTHLPIKDAE
jgi:hypothetical protein